jgi:branched-chain amino acid transport system permease protein
MTQAADNPSASDNPRAADALGAAARRRGERYEVVTWTRTATMAALVSALVVASLAALPFVADRETLQALFTILTLLALAQFWNLLAGYAGLVSIGQQAFVGIGGYMLFALTVVEGLPPVAAIPLAGLVAAALALPCAFFVFRLRNAYFAIGTWVLAEVGRLSLAQVRTLGGGTGMSLPKAVTNDSALVAWAASVTGTRTAAARDIAAYWMALGVAIGAIALVFFCLRTRRGLALAAIRDNEEAARSVGIEPLAIKLFVYVVSAFGAGVTGALIYLQKARISPDAAFSVTDWTAFVFFIVIIGGIATIEGPIVGVLIFWGLQRELSSYGTWYLMLLGALAIGMMLFCPAGLWGLVARRHDLGLFPVRRLLVVAKDVGTARTADLPSEIPPS